MKKYFFRIIIVGALAFSWSGSAFADWKADVGFTALQSELGASLPTGAGVKVTQVEAAGGKPDPVNAEFSGKSFTDKTTWALTVSGHATSVGQLFYGNSISMAPGITNIENYDSGDWKSSFLRSGYTSVPLISSSRVGNHSYVGSDAGYAKVNFTLARMDWVVNRDEFIQATAMNNGGTNYPYVGSSFNAISVGLSNGGNSHGAYALVTTPTTPYASAARTKPDIVVPQSATSWATPTVASAAALLVDEGHKGGNTLSTDPSVKFTTNRNGDTIYNAERSETVKAALMAGASRTSANLGTRYSINTNNGLNNILGAGELNILNSYHILAGGEQNSKEDKASTNGNINKQGFDYDPQFGGSSSTNRTGTYVFHANSAGTLSASLVWNLQVAGGSDGSFDTTATLTNLGLYLYDTTTSTEVIHFTSTVDNTQNISTALTAGHDYRLQVKAETPENFNWDYSLAWSSNASTDNVDTTPPVISNGSPSGTLAAGTTQTNISLTTNENATCKYATSANTAYASMTGTFSTTGSTSHSTAVTGLTNGQTKSYYVRCQDGSGNANTSDYPISFSVANSTPTYSNADLNQDTKIDLTDFNILKTDFLRLTGSLSNPRSDIDGDGQATIKDIGILMSGWK